MSDSNDWHVQLVNIGHNPANVKLCWPAAQEWPSGQPAAPRYASKSSGQGFGIRTIWIVHFGEDFPRLVTAYPRTQR